MALPHATQNKIEQMARIVGDTGVKFTNSRPGCFFAQCRKDGSDLRPIKRKCLYDACCCA